MKKRIKKLAVILCIVLCVTSLHVPAYAEDTPLTTTDYISFSWSGYKNHTYSIMEEGTWFLSAKFSSGTPYRNLPDYLMGHTILQQVDTDLISVKAKTDCFVYILAADTAIETFVEQGFEVVVKYSAGEIYPNAMNLLEKKFNAEEEYSFEGVFVNTFATAEGIKYPRASEDISKYRDNGIYTYPSKSGYVFAGWYTDAEYTKPLNADIVEGQAYPKFISEKVLTAKAQITSMTNVKSNKTDMRFVTTLDSLDYINVGFDITIAGHEKKTFSTQTVYEKLYTVGNDAVIDPLDPAETFSSDSKYFAAFCYWNIPANAFEQKFTVTPFFTTFDGTVVYGETSVKTVSMGFIPDFIVEVDSASEPLVLQLTDTQIIDSSQERTSDRLNDTCDTYWGKDKAEERCYAYVRETVEKTNPDLILITGDLVYGEFDDNGTAFSAFVEFMDSFEIPWAPVFGNHENESKKGVDWQCEQLEKAQYCLFKQRALTGNGNYTVGIQQGGELKRVFVMLDSNGCGNASEESLANGHTVTSTGFGSDQILWYTDIVKHIKAISPQTKISFAFHIQLAAFAEAYEAYGFDNSTTKESPINIDRFPNKAESDFGYLGRPLKSMWDVSNRVWYTLKELEVDSIFVGHEHCNSASVMYDGVRFQYGQKSSTYDRANFVDAQGKIVGATAADYTNNYIPLCGGTVIPLSAEDGSIVNPHIYLCEDAGGNIDWDSFVKPEISVSGLQYGSDLFCDNYVTVTADSIDGTNAWKCDSTGQSKVYIKTNLLTNKEKVTFSVYLPTSSTAVLTGMGEFAIRVKPNGLVSGNYIKYNSNATNENLKLEFGKWKTFTVDISSYGERCTEFAFNIAAGNVIYLKDIVIE